MSRRLLPVLSAGLLLLAACGSSEDGTASGESPAPEGPPPTESTSESTSTTSSTPDPSPTAVEVEATELTATDRGVEAGVIRLGLALTDVSQFANVGDVRARFEAVTAAVNAAGGVGGRLLELVIEEWSLTDPAALSASCTALTEDNDVFLVLAWATNSDLTCYTSLQEHIVINSFDLPADFDPLLFTVLADAVATMLENLDLLAPELEGAKVAIHSADGYQDLVGTARSELEALGAEVVVETQGSPVESQADQLAIEAETDIYLERWDADGATFVLNLGGGQAVLGALERGGSDITMIGSNNNVQTMSAFVSDLASVNLLVIASPTVNDDAEAGLYGIPECIATIEDATGQEILIRPEEGDERGLVSTVRACSVLDTFVAIATEAGADLTEESFLAAMETLGEYQMTGAESGSLGADKHHAANSAAEVYVYDPDVGDFVRR